jgi:hypothetical protein
MSDPRSLARAGIGAYALSFFLASVAGTGTRGYGCAIVALLGPFIAFGSPSGSAEFFDGNPLGFVALFVSGLVNIVFPLAMFLKFKRYSSGFAIARIAVLAMDSMLLGGLRHGVRCSAGGTCLLGGWNVAGAVLRRARRSPPRRPRGGLVT